MLDLTTLRGRLIAAAFRLAEQRPWSQVSLFEIAEGAGTNLAGLRKEFSSKGEIVAAFSRAIDDEVLARAQRRGAGQAARDAVFEVIMSRFDALAPYKRALRSIAADSTVDWLMLRAALDSQAWMLRAAGIDAEGLEGRMKAAGLAATYASVFRTWLDDDDPGLARTMAALDRRLRRGERALSTLAEITGICQRIASMIGLGRRGTQAAASPPQSAPESPERPPSPSI